MICHHVTMLPGVASALAGLQASATRVNVRAQNIVNIQTPGYIPAVPVQSATAAGPSVRVDRGYAEAGLSGPAIENLAAFTPNVFLAGELVDMKLAEHAYKASAAVLKTADRLAETMLDIVS